MSPEAHDAYLKGRFHWYKLTPQDLDRSLRYFERALALDPQYALAHTGIAQYWTGLAAAGAMPPREAMARARAEASKAAAIDPALAEAHHLLAVIAVWHDFDWSGGESQFRRALALKPGLPDARLFYGLFLAALGRFEEARTEIARALDLDPYNFFFVWISGFALLLERRYVEAKAQIRKALAMEPAFATAHWGLWSALHAERRQEEALVEAEAALGLFAAGAPEAAGLLAMGGPAGYQTAMSRAAGTLARRAGKYVMGTVVAELYACAGERTEALSWLERAYENRDIPMAYLGVHPAWDDLRGEPRFQQLLLRLNLAARP